MTRHLLNAAPWKQIVSELHAPPVAESILHSSESSPLTSTPGVPVELSEKEELRRRQFGSVNQYVHALEQENETLKRRVRVLEQMLADSSDVTPLLPPSR